MPNTHPHKLIKVATENNMEAQAALMGQDDALAISLGLFDKADNLDDLDDRLRAREDFITARLFKERNAAERTLLLLEHAKIKRTRAAIETKDDEIREKQINVVRSCTRMNAYVRSILRRANQALETLCKRFTQALRRAG